MVKEGKQKERTCAGCRQLAIAQELERFVVLKNDGSTLIHDPFMKLPGRGTYLHVARKCLESGLKSGLRRSLKQEITLDKLENVAQTLYNSILKRVRETIRASYRSEDVFLFEEGVQKAFQQDQLQLLIIASDAGDATKNKYDRNAQRKGVPVNSQLFSREELGNIVGRPHLVLIGFAGKLAARMIADVTKLSELEKIKKME